MKRLKAVEVWLSREDYEVVRQVMAARKEHDRGHDFQPRRQMLNPVQADHRGSLGEIAMDKWLRSQGLRPSGPDDQKGYYWSPLIVPDGEVIRQDFRVGGKWLDVKTTLKVGGMRPVRRAGYFGFWDTPRPGGEARPAWDPKGYPDLYVAGVLEETASVHKVHLVGAVTREVVAASQFVPGGPSTNALTGAAQDWPEYRVPLSAFKPLEDIAALGRE